VSKKNFNPKSIKTNNGAIIEYNRLRSLYRRDLQHLVGNKKKNENISDKNIYLRRQTTAILEPTILDTNVSSKKNASKVILHNIRGMENPNNACYAKY